MKKNLGLVVMVFCAFVSSKSAQTAYTQDQVQTRIVSDTELVRMSVIVFDDKGAVATNLKKTDFRLFEDGVQQDILSLGMERVPVSFVILADLSSSMTRKIPFVQDAALSLIDAPERPVQESDEYSVLGVGKRSELLIPFSRDQEDLEKQVPRMLTATNESTALFDGVWLGVSTVEDEAANRQCAMIIITDGGDNHSRYSLQQTRKLLTESDVPAFAVMAGPSFELPEFLSDPEGKSSPFPAGKGSGSRSPHVPIATTADDYIGPAERRGPRNMKVLTEASGGGVFTARREEDLPRIVRTIGLAVRYRYVLSYRPAHSYTVSDNRENVAVQKTHKILLELYPKEKFSGYSLPYYKRTYEGAY